MQESLQQLRNKLINHVITDDDQWRYEQLTKKYNSIFDEFIDRYLLDDIPQVHEAIKVVLLKAQVKEFLLMKEIVVEVDRVLKRAAN